MENNRPIRKLKMGDKESVNCVFEQYYDKVYGYCYRHVTHRETAQDLTQEVFLRVFKHMEDYRHYGKFENYLYVIAGNLCKDFYKKNRFLSLEEMELQVEEEGFLQTEQALIVKEALSRSAGVGKGDYLSAVLSGQKNQRYCKDTEFKAINNKISFKKGTGIVVRILAG